MAIRRYLGLRPIINASGTMTALGASIMVPEAIAVIAAIEGINGSMASCSTA
jgi:L-seryl-tRNA(Ser) seleniumtransferase